MFGTFQALLANLAIISILLSAWSVTFQWSLRLTTQGRGAAMVVAGGSCAALLMALPIELRPGIILDLRAVPIAFAGYFGGPIVGVLVGTIAALFRLYIGGVGAPPAVIGITAVTVLGIVMGQICARHLTSPRCMILLSGLVAPISIVGTFLLPAEIRAEVVRALAVPGMVACFIGMLLVSAAIASELRRLQLAARNQLYRSLMDAFPEPLNAKDDEGRFIAANPATADMMRVGTADALIGKTDFDFYPEDVAATFRRDEEAALAAGKPTIVEQHVARRDGSTAWMATLKAPLVDLSGEPIGLLTHNRDITELKQLRDERERTLGQLDDALSHMADALAVYDQDNRLVLCNDQYRSMFPKTAAQRVPGARLGDLLQASLDTGDIVNVPAPEQKAWVADMLANRQSSRQHDLVLGDGRTVAVRIQPGSSGTSVVVISDVTEARRAEKDMANLNRRLDELARTDSLTGLANRRVFDATLAAEVQRSARAGLPLGLLLIDIDHFKDFNDRHGHIAGDACLRQIGQALLRTVSRPADLVARYGGEEFAVILPDTDAPGAWALAQRLLAQIRRLSIDHGAESASLVTVSIGVASQRGGDDIDPLRLVRSADAALYRAKAEGRNRAVADAALAHGPVEIRPVDRSGSETHHPS